MKALQYFLAGAIGGFFCVWLVKWLRDGLVLFNEWRTVRKRTQPTHKGLSDRPRKGLRWPR